MDDTKSETIFNKLNHVFKLISFGKLKDDIDDSLLEKLITFVKEENEKSGNFVTEMLRRTELEKYLEKALNRELSDINCTTVSFLLKLLAVCHNHNDILSSLERNEKKLLCLISNIFEEKNYQVMNFSVKVSVLEFLSILAAKEQYILWLHSNGAIDFGMCCLGEDSLYVQRTAANLIAIQLSTLLNASKCNAINKDNFLKIFEDTLLELFNYLQDSSISLKLDRSRKLIDSTVEVFRIFSELQPNNKTLIPVPKVIDIINRNLRSNKMNEIYINKLLELLSIFVSPWQDQCIIEELVKKLIDVKHIHAILHFLSLSIIRNQSNETLSKEIMDIFLSPLSYLTDTGDVPPYILSCLESTLNNKNSTIKIINLNISSISKIAKKLSCQQKQEICLQLQSLLSLTTECSVRSTLQGYPFNCQRLQVALLTFFLDNFELYDSEYIKLDISRLTTAVINLLESPNTVSPVIDKCTKLLGKLLCLWGKLCVQQDEEWGKFPPLDAFRNVLTKRLLDPNWEVIDSTLCLINDIFFSHEDIIPWFCKQSFHTIIWDIANSEVYEGYIRATAIQTVSYFILSAEGWKRLFEDKKISLDNALLIYCRALLCDSDTFVHRAAAKAIFNWIESKDVPQYFYKSLYLAVTTDLDWEVKMSALKSWEFILNQNLTLSNNNDQKLLTDLCQCGFARSFTSAIEDHDKTVQNVAVKILLDLIGHLTSINTDTSSSGLNNFIRRAKDDLKLGSDSMSISINDESRSRIIESVLDIETDKQICDLIKPISKVNDVVDILHSTDIEMDVKDFVEILQSENLRSILEESEKSTDLYTNNFESLLDDIINCEDTKFPGMDCY
ncbi:uncharacterized protein LOC111636375 isoform X1 [Centruroides sculpturatus]|uniref:uncharacterized protein LOC111636375 isoform X1 n=2 Tax=Centruroides sculpturatus TaxID=218467 RepID=UPI000C6D2E0E|nr:uncharacterized protein LOC111636375 isoform X1 [Centruroides sculpturatus]